MCSLLLTTQNYIKTLLMGDYYLTKKRAMQLKDRQGRLRKCQLPESCQFPDRDPFRRCPVRQYLTAVLGQQAALYLFLLQLHQPICAVAAKAHLCKVTLKIIKNQHFFHYFRRAIEIIRSSLLTRNKLFKSTSVVESLLILFCAFLRGASSLISLPLSLCFKSKTFVKRKWKEKVFSLSFPDF